MIRPRGARHRALEVQERLAEAFPDAECALLHRNPFELLVATILSAQCTDVRVNLVTPRLFERYPTPGDLAAADPEELEELIRPTGFFRTKARNLLGMAERVEEVYGGEIPRELHDLVSLPGVGRKTGNVVRSVAFGLPGLPVDTHVGRIARRLKLTREDDPVKVETDLCAVVAPEEWGTFSMRLILHGRATCVSRKPRCDACVLSDVCPSAGPVAPSRIAVKGPTLSG